MSHFIEMGGKSEKIGGILEQLLYQLYNYSMSKPECKCENCKCGKKDENKSWLDKILGRQSKISKKIDFKAVSLLTAVFLVQFLDHFEK